MNCDHADFDFSNRVWGPRLGRPVKQIAGFLFGAVKKPKGYRLWIVSCLPKIRELSSRIGTPNRFTFYENRAFRQRTEMDCRKIANAFRESDRFGLSKPLC
jgi:hypothetical protein